MEGLPAMHNFDPKSESPKSDKNSVSKVLWNN